MSDRVVRDELLTSERYWRCSPEARRGAKSERTRVQSVVVKPSKRTMMRVTVPGGHWTVSFQPSSLGSGGTGSPR